MGVPGCPERGILRSHSLPVRCLSKFRLRSELECRRCASDPTPAQQKEGREAETAQFSADFKFATPPPPENLCCTEYSGILALPLPLGAFT